MDCSTLGFPVQDQLPELAQTHVHWVSDAIQPSHPLLSPSPPAFNLAQHQGLFKMSQFFVSGGQSIGASVSASVLPMNIQDWFPLGLTTVQGTLRSLLHTTVQKHQFFKAQLYSPTLTSIHDYWKTIASTRWTFVSKVMSLRFNRLSRLVIAFLPKSKCLLILWFQSPSAVILEFKKIKSLTVSIVSPSISHELMGCHDLGFWMLSFKPTFSLSSFIFTKRLFNFSSLYAIRVMSFVYLRLLIFLPAIFCFIQPSISHEVLCIEVK